MKHAFIENGIVKQVQPIEYDIVIINKKEVKRKKHKKGFVEVSDDVICGMTTKDNKIFTKPSLTKTQTEDKFRLKRNDLLNVVDHYQKVLIYNSLSDIQKEELSTYRQELLDATSTWIMPIKPTWIA